MWLKCPNAFRGHKFFCKQHVGSKMNPATLLYARSTLALAFIYAAFILFCFVEFQMNAVFIFCIVLRILSASHLSFWNCFRFGDL